MYMKILEKFNLREKRNNDVKVASLFMLATHSFPSEL